MIRQCAWCKLILGQIMPYLDETTTHTICPDCAKKVHEQINNLSIRQHLCGVSHG